ncbi:MAG: haloalkane dehalogenase [Gammaproteobacteria bacterium]
MTRSALRTPESRFDNLPDYPFAPHYIELPDDEFGTLRMHYLDEGKPDAHVILLLSTQGCWSYIYRRMIPLLVAAGYRVIAPDYIGFGRSDKLPETEDYSFQRHIDWNIAFLDGLQLRGITGYLLDWGGFFGLRIAAERPEIFARLALSNTNLPHGDSPGKSWFVSWRAEQFAKAVFPQGEMVNEGTYHELSPETIAAFDAPYPDETYKTGPRRFPMILPISADDPASPANTAAWEKLGSWEKPVLTLYSKDFEGSAMGPARVLNHIPGCRGQDHALLEHANFYIVEDQSEELARRLIAFAGS